MEDKAQRKLAVILHADVVGSTSLVQRNETLAHERIQRAFRLLSQTIRSYGGIAHEVRGDALVAEFERASDAVSAALAFQIDNSQTKANLEDSIRPELRVGIGIGEVVIADGTVTGAGVVLAQRLEQLAESGGVCIQGAAYETVPQRLPFDYKSLGDQEVKGFEQPVRAYNVSLRPGETVPEPDTSIIKSKKGKSDWRRGVGIAVILLVVAGLLFVWIRSSDPIQEPVSIDQIVKAHPQQPSIAILPFTNMSGDLEQEYFADGMTDDLITDLSKIPGLTVISRTSSFAYKGKSEDIRDIASALNANYVVEGSARRANDKIRINAQLIDAKTGHHIWAERYDNSLEEIFKLQDLITAQIAEALDSEIGLSSTKTVSSRNPENLEAYDIFLKGRGIFQRFSKDDTFLARKLFLQATELDPQFSRAFAMLAWTYVFEYTNGWSAEPSITLQHAQDLADKSISLDSKSPVAHFVKGLVFRERKEYEKALNEAKKAIEIEPSYANGYVLTATVLYYTGEPQEGLDMLEIASRLNPLHPSNYPFHKGQALFILKRYEEAVEAFEFGLNQNPTSQRLRVWLAATYAQMGFIEEAKWEAAEILSEDPNFSPVNLETIFPFQNSEDLQAFNLALSKAGFKDLSGN
jgi:TolB-like protein/class 3 adenylate cyclase